MDWDAWKIIRLTCFAFCALAVGACKESSESADPSNLAVFDVLTLPGAVDVARRRLGPGNAWQLDYRIEMPYPRVALGGEAVEALQDRGWAQCHKQSQGWERYPEQITERESRCVYRQARYFRKDRLLLTIVNDYEGPTVTDDRCPGEPPGPMQWVFVIVTEEPAIEAQLSQLGLSC